MRGARPRDIAHRGFGAPASGGTVAIVGGGFCGTLAAIRLLRAKSRSGVRPVSRIVLIDPDAPGRGLAYCTGPAHWLLNVPAERMSAFAEQPSDFLDWARTRHPTARGADYLPRAWYGDYLTSRLWLARRQAAPGVSFEHVRARATDLERASSGWRLTLDDGAQIDAQQVLLALGNSPPAAIRGFVGSTIADPWRGDWIERLPQEPNILLVGTGLTMIDIALSIAAARPRARMTALSRHGLLPRPHATTWPARHAAPFPALSALGSGALHTRLRTLREFIAAWNGPHADWRAALQTVRQAMPDLWSTLPIAERSRFLRHLRTWWDVHRHRVPLQTLARIESLRARGRLAIRAGRLVAADRASSEVRWRPRGSDQVLTEQFDVVVNVTGADADPRHSSCALVRSILARGFARADELGIGWQTDDDGRLISAQDVDTQGLYYAGPLLRARVWEATAVPELRAHVDATVESICSSLAWESAARSVK